jgi:SNF2 family DNA or RNA helicase
MLILHASFLDDQLLLWGEAPIGARGSKRKVKTQLQASPFDVGQESLTTALTTLLPAMPARERKTENLTAWLPTIDGQPVASSPLIAEPPPPGIRAVLRPWTVTAVRLSYEAAVTLLCACIGREMLSPGVLVGKTLSFWEAALRLAGTLLAREQFLPGVEASDKALRARWEPVVAGVDAQRLAQLAQAMPAACRALSHDAENAPQTPAALVLSSFLQEMTDGLVRATAPLTAAGKRVARGKKIAFDSVHDEWLHALRSADGALQGKKSEQQILSEQIQEWRRPISVATAAPYRLCFRLEEPEDKDEPREKPVADGDWYLRFLLQGVSDPSLLLPVADVWNSKGRQDALLKQGGFNVREYLLTALGQAAGVYPEIDKSLKTAAPGGITLGVQEAFNFLADRAAVLEQAGFGVLLPGWWTRKGTKQRLTLQAGVHTRSMQGAGTLSLESLVEFDWQVALGGEVLTQQELQTLARLKAPLVKVRGQWVQMTAEEIQAALAYWQKKGQATLRVVVQLALGATRTAGGLEFAGVKATGWVGNFLEELEGRHELEMLTAPEEFQGTLRPYQQRGYSWLAFLQRWGLGACLADDMGLGKTVQTLALLERNWESGPRRPVLLVCPMSVVGNWQKEAQRFTPNLPVLVHHGQKRIKGAAFKAAAEKQALVLSSYSLLHRDFNLFKEVTWGGVLLDEAQNIKNPETKQARAARSLPAEFRVALTGTPVENHVGDLWSILEFLNPGFLGNQAAFRRNFMIPIQAYNDADAGRKLKRLTGPFILRRLKSDKTIIADLPEKLEMKVYCNLTREQASLYAAVVEEANKALSGVGEGIQRRGLILGTLSKLKQVCNHPAQFLGDNSALPDRSGKLARLTEMLEEVLDVGDRALIFTQFTEMGDLIKRHLQETFGKEVLFLHGGTSKKERDRMVARFQGTEGDGAADRPQLFLLSLKAGGTGLNLTAANHVFHFDRWWNPAVENQATDRAFRIGQTRNVQVHKFLCVGTLEERIDEMIEQKQKVAGLVVGAGEGWLTELSNEQLKELFALRQEALGE